MPARPTKCTRCGRTNGNRCSRCDETEVLNDVFEVCVLQSTPENEVTMKDIFPEDETCSSCFRISTSFYPLHFINLQWDTFMRRHFISSLNSDRVTLCHLCNSYLTPLSPQFKHTRTFKLGWPSVFWQLSNDKTTTTRFWNFLPVEMRIGWLNKTA